MKCFLPLLALVLFPAGGILAVGDGARVLPKVDLLPVALNSDFQFRKAKLFSLGVIPANETKVKTGGKKKGGGGGGSRINKAIAEASISFEGTYRSFGAVTTLDTVERWGNYFDFFWQARRDAAITMRLEYRQEKLRSFTQAREIRYPHARGHHKTEFAIIGDDFFEDGRVIAWRCLMVENGQVVAEKRSYLWR